MSRDPIEYADGENLYAAYFVPNRVDPLGLAATRVCLPELLDGDPVRVPVHEFFGLFFLDEWEGLIDIKPDAGGVPARAWSKGTDVWMGNLVPFLWSEGELDHSLRVNVKCKKNLEVVGEGFMESCSVDRITASSPANDNDPPVSVILDFRKRIYGDHNERAEVTVAAMIAFGGSGGGSLAWSGPFGTSASISPPDGSRYRKRSPTYHYECKLKWSNRPSSQLSPFVGGFVLPGIDL